MRLTVHTQVEMERFAHRENFFRTSTLRHSPKCVEGEFCVLRMQDPA
jgi:hypothetical protein